MYKIYGLVNTLTNKIFYVGQTRQPLTARLIQTRYEWRNSKGGRAKHRAITRIYQRGGNISIVELDRSTTQREIDRLEQNHISYLLDKGYHLCNTSRGGAGNWGVKRDQDQRDRIARSVSAYHQSRRHPHPSSDPA